ncbi:MAG: M3 family oligoendopeptidase [Roseburia sp.]|nr:M3 family oligoendopeptidase [Roseburia sp.]
MKTEWNLEVLYKGLDDPAYEADMKRYEEAQKEFVELYESVKNQKPEDVAEALLLKEEETAVLLRKLSEYISLRQAVETENGDLMAQMNRLVRIYNNAVGTMLAAEQFVAKIEDIDAAATKSEVIAAYRAMILRNKEKEKYMFSDEVETMISAMEVTGGSAWGQLQSYLTSTVKVDYEGEQITLTQVRNLANSPDAAVRKAAYEAEIAAYEKIEDALAFALNNIKNQVTMLCEKRGYESPLAMTLMDARMKRETLDAMMEAIKEYLPTFRKYLRKKGEMLGHNNGLPWYELFAPMGKVEKTYTVEEARDYLVNCFSNFSTEMSDMMAEAFDNEWIDFFPRKGKEGGAFCAGVECIKQSRILTNFDGSFSSIGTLAHELGHAYHNLQIQNERIMNQDYPMPVAETASTFNETHLGQHAVAQASGEELLNLLENDLKEQTQCIVDIYSRYLFETAVFEQSQNKFLMAADMKELMLNAQKEAYGDGLDENCMHPYMWACKGHYYSSGLSFYNFPYAFGNLFALGLYSKFLEEGESFVPKYNALLNATAKCSVEEAGAMVGIDLTNKEFWKSSLALIAKNIEKFCEL